MSTPSVEAFRLFFKNSPSAAALLDRERNYLATSPGWLPIHGLTDHPLRGTPVQEVLPEHPQRWLELSHRCLAEARELREEGALRWPDGSLRWLCWELRPWFESPEVVGGLLITGQDLSRRRRLDEYFRDQPNLLQSLEDRLPCSYVYQFLHSDQGQRSFLYISAGVEQVHGLTAEEVMSNPELLFQQLEPGQLEAYQRAERVSGESLSDLRMELRYSTGPGLQRWLLLQSRPREVPHGVLWDGVATEISAYKAAAEELRLHQAMLEDAGRIARVGGWSFKVDSGEGFWTDEVARIHGLDPEVSPTREIGLGFYPPADRLRLEAALEAAIQRAIPYDLELQLTTVQGELKWVRSIGHPVVNQGKVVRLRGSFQDITERKNIEQNLRSQSAFLAAQLESNLDAILVVDDRGTPLHYNQRFRDLFPQPDPGGGDWKEPVLARARSPQEFLECFADHERRPETRSRVEMELLDGTRLERYSSPVRGTDEQHFGRIWTFRDITDIHRLREQVRQAQKMEAVGQLAGGVAHDFNNLLAVIQLEAETLIAEGKAHGPLEESAQAIVDTTRRAANLTRQLLLFSRRQSFRMTALELNESLRAISRMLLRILGEHIELEVHLCSQKLLIQADNAMLDQIIVNLCVNARDAMPNGGRLLLETSCDLEAGLARLKVQDTGCGISSDHLGRIFEPFFTTKPPGQGTGLGLATVFGIMQQHQGNIEVQSEVGAGSTFLLTFPLSPDREASPAPDPVVLSSSGTHPSRAILLVEDDAGVRRMLKRTLERLGYAVLDARDGPEAEACFAQNRDRISLVITDIVMPGGLNGRQLVERLQQAQPGLRAIYCSGYSEEVLGPEVRLIPGVNYLSKPFSPAELSQALEANLGDES